ncbi:MAG TPA: sodium:proton antiporter [Lentisphaeria bacterium]|nr:MAG: sodium:proton antiporter [Lentisphaerae bacterium GWF2_38_69]HBM15491.1 sodium:proton antiporter [Lentisphaeria bacterium]
MESLIIAIFIIGYAAIAFEHFIKVNKAASALITGVLCWTVYILYSTNHHDVSIQLEHHLGGLSGILFFLLCAMTIVEIIDAHKGFDFVTSLITQKDKRKLLWILSFVTFFMSSALDNLTTTIVVISLLKKLVHETKDRLFFAGIMVIAANAGGAWSPIGDVTTTMLWIGNQITTSAIIYQCIFPSIISLMLPLLVVSFHLKGNVKSHEKTVINYEETISLSQRHQRFILFCGLSLLLLIPVFKTITHLPPYMGALIALGILWVITEFINDKKDEKTKMRLSIGRALKNVDTQSILFFLGILLSVASLESIGVLSQLSTSLATHIKNQNMIVYLIGMISAIIDNVPLVAAAQGMYGLSIYPTDNSFWLFLAYAAGNGGSILIIGSAAGVAAMGLEKISFFWYLKKISFLAFLGYSAGALAFILQQYFIS